MAVTDHPAHPDQMVHPAVLAKTEKKDQQASQLLASHRHPVMSAQPAKADHPVHLVKMAHLAQTAVPAHQEAKVHRARLVHPATMALLATKDHQVQMDPKENRVYAPNIAPPMAVFSSKMEQGDKRSQQAFDRICYSDEKPVFFMSMFFFGFFIFLVFNEQLSSSSSSTTNYYCRCVSPVLSFGAF
jgi:hypothetical protein